MKKKKNFKCTTKNDADTLECRHCQKSSRELLHLDLQWGLCFTWMTCEYLFLIIEIYLKYFNQNSIFGKKNSIFSISDYIYAATYVFNTYKILWFKGVFAGVVGWLQYKDLLSECIKCGPNCDMFLFFLDVVGGCLFSYFYFIKGSIICMWFLSQLWPDL